jgi:hypothetical protein
MTRVGLVMGFGFGQANDDLAAFVAAQHKSKPFCHILAQDAVLGPLRRRKLAVEPMHEHCPVYVNTEHALGLSLMRLAGLEIDQGPVEIEVIAHGAQSGRALKSAHLAKTWLGNSRSSPDRLRAFLQRITFLDPTPPTMRMNHLSDVMGAWFKDLIQLRVTLPQLWTWSPRLYKLVDAHAEKRLVQPPEEFHSDLICLQSRLTAASH